MAQQLKGIADKKAVDSRATAASKENILAHKYMTMTDAQLKGAMNTPAEMQNMVLLLIKAIRILAAS